MYIESEFPFFRLEASKTAFSNSIGRGFRVLCVEEKDSSLRGLAAVGDHGGTTIRKNSPDVMAAVAAIGEMMRDRGNDDAGAARYMVRSGWAEDGSW